MPETGAEQWPENEEEPELEQRGGAGNRGSTKPEQEARVKSRSMELETGAGSKGPELKARAGSRRNDLEPGARSKSLSKEPHPEVEKGAEAGSREQSREPEEYGDVCKEL